MVVDIGEFSTQCNSIPQMLGGQGEIYIEYLWGTIIV